MTPAEARGSGGAQKMSKAASKVAISSLRLTNTALSAPRKSCCFFRSIKVSARVASVSRRGPASRPASWRSRANAPSRGSRSALRSPSPLPDPPPCRGREIASGTSRLLDQRRHLLTDALQVLLVLERRAEGRVHERGVDPSRAEGGQGSRPVERLRHSRHLVQLHGAKALDQRGHLSSETFGRLRCAGPHDLDLLLEVGVVDPVVEASALERVVHLAGSVRRDDHERRLLGLDRPDLGDRDLEVGEQLEEKRLELLVGAIDLIDQKHRRRRVVVVDGVQERAAQQELRAEDLPLGGPPVLAFAQQTDVEQLPRIVPLVHGVREVDALVALQADEARAQDLRHHLGRLGLADARLALDEERLFELEGQEDGRGQTAVADVAALAQAPLDLVDARRSRHPAKHYRQLVRNNPIPGKVSSAACPAARPGRHTAGAPARSAGARERKPPRFPLIFTRLVRSLSWSAPAPDASCTPGWRAGRLTG